MDRMKRGSSDERLSRSIDMMMPNHPDKMECDSFCRRSPARLSMKVPLLGIALLMVLSLFAATVSARQYGTNFKFKDLDEMRDDGWMISHPEGVLLGKDGVTLDGTTGTAAVFIAAEMDAPIRDKDDKNGKDPMEPPPPILDWRVGVRGVWPGGGNAYLNATVNTSKRSYACVADGASGKWQLQRNGTAVAQGGGYRPVAGAVVEMYMEKIGPTITITCGGKVVARYAEKDPAPVASVGMVAPKGTRARYVWAGAFIPEVSLEGGTDSQSGEGEDATADDPSADETTTTEVNESPSGWEAYDPSDDSLLDDLLNNLYDSWFALLQDGTGQTSEGEGVPSAPLAPAGTVVGESQPPASEDDLQPESSSAPPAASPAGTPQPLGPGNWMVIVVLPSTFTMNTDVSEYDAGAETYACGALVNGVSYTPYVGVWCESDRPHVEQEVALQMSGQTSPETSMSSYHPYCDCQPGYFVKIDTHVSGKFDTLAHAQAAVAIITAQVTDANGQVLYSNRITEVSSNGHTLGDLHQQAAQGINTWMVGEVARISGK